MALVFPKNVPLDRFSPFENLPIGQCITASAFWNFNFFRMTPNEFTRFVNQVSWSDIEVFKNSMIPLILNDIFDGDVDINNDDMMSSLLTECQKLKWLHKLCFTENNVATIG